MNRYTKFILAMGILAIALAGMVVLNDSEESDAVDTSTYDVYIPSGYTGCYATISAPGYSTVTVTPGPEGGSLTVSVGTTVTITATAGTGYEFSRWIRMPTTPVTTTPSYSFTATTSSAGFGAEFNTVTTYNIGVGVYQSIGGTASVSGGGESTSSSGSTSYVTVADSTLMTFTATPSSGYHFVKWIAGSDEAFPTDNPIGFIVMGKDMTFRAVFEADPSSSHTYTLSYNANGGTGAPATQTATSSASSYTFTISPTTPTRSGYNFLGWSGTYDATVVHYNPGDSIEVSWFADDGHVPLYAVWESIPTHTITVNSESTSYGTVTGGATDVPGTPVSISATPKPGYQFSNWTITGGGTIANPSSASTTVTIGSDDGTVTAHFTAVTPTPYTITVNSENTSYGIVTGGATDVPGTLVSVSATPKPGYQFSNWTITGSGTITNTSSASTTVTIGSGNGTVTAHFTAAIEQHTVSFNAQGGSPTPASTTVTVGQTYASSTNWPAANPTKSGYAFIGWFTDTNYTTQITGSDTVSIHQDITLYAKWSTNAYTVKYYRENSTSSTLLGQEQVEYNGHAQQYINGIAVPGYDFVKWVRFSGADFTASSTVTDDTNVYGVYNAKSITVNFNANGGTVSPAFKNVTYNDTYGALPTPVKTGYAFAGWFSDQALTTRVTDTDTVTATSNITLYAKWTENVPTTVTVTYHRSLADPTQIGQETLAVGGKITKTSGIPVEGYRWIKWLKIDQSIFDANTLVTGNLDLYGVYTEYENTSKIDSEAQKSADGKTTMKFSIVSDIEHTSVKWYIDGDLVDGFEDTLTIDLPYGEYTVSAKLMDGMQNPLITITADVDVQEVKDSIPTDTIVKIAIIGVIGIIAGAVLFRFVL